jgi:SAM-dependent methyltransferase
MTRPLQRTPEPELMDEAAQAQAYAAADFAAPHERFVDLFVDSWSPARGPAAGIVLDVGCGPADVVVRLARRCPRLVVDGVDGAEQMLALGRRRVTAEGLGNRVRLYRALLPDAPLPRTAYDVVTSNSILHHLHEPQVLWRTLWRAARPGAHVFVMDLRRPPTLAVVDDLVERYVRDEPDVLRHDFRASLCAAFTVDEVRQQLDAAGLGGLRVDVVSDRHLTVRGRMP